MNGDYSKSILTDDMVKALTPLAKKIVNMDLKIDEARKYQQKIETSRDKYLKVFDVQTYKYLIMGFLCIACLLFDFFVNTKTLKFFSDAIEANTYLVAIIFAIIDAGVSIMASGIFAKNRADFHSVQRRWRIILWLLAIIKLTFFIVFIWDEPSAIINILIFSFLILLIYFVFHISGAGLWYVLGNIWYIILSTLGNTPEYLISNKLKLCVKFRSLSTDIGANVDDAIKNFHLENLCQ